MEEKKSIYEFMQEHDNKQKKILLDLLKKEYLYYCKLEKMTAEKEDFEAFNYSKKEALHFLNVLKKSKIDVSDLTQSVISQLKMYELCNPDWNDDQDCFWDWIFKSIA